MVCTQKTVCRLLCCASPSMECIQSSQSSKSFRFQDLRTAVDLGRKHPVWFKKNMKTFAAWREVFIPAQMEHAAWDLEASVSDIELGAWAAVDDECDSIMGIIGAAWRMTVDHPGTLEHPSFKPSVLRAVKVQETDLPEEPIAYVMQLEAVLTMATAFCCRENKSESIEEWLLE